MKMLFYENELYIVIQFDMNIVSSTYRPYLQEINLIRYINTESNHPNIYNEATSYFYQTPTFFINP